PYNQELDRSVAAPSTPISVTLGNPNYTWANSTQTGSLTIRKAELTGQINTATRVYGEAISPGAVLAKSITWDGFKNSDDASAVTAAFIDQPLDADVGTYSLSVDGLATATNYHVTILEGKLRIEP